MNPDDPSAPIDVPGRKALFTTITPHHGQISPASLSLPDIITQLVAYDGEETLQLPTEWKPLVDRLSTILHDYSEKEREFNEVWNEFNILSNSINKIEEEHKAIDVQYQDIHINYNALLAELKTERECLSESFAHHQVPMALITSKSEIVYANDAFRSLLDIDQKEIEKGERLLIEFSDEEDEEILVTSNGYRLGCSILSPPPVLPGAMYADSLVVLMGHKPRVGTRDVYGSYEELIDLFLFPAVLIEKDFTIVRANEEFYRFTTIDPNTRDLISDDAPVMAALHHVIDEVMKSQVSYHFEETLYRDEIEQNVTVHLFPVGEQVLCILTPVDENVNRYANTDTALLAETLLQLHPGPVAILDEHFSVMAANEAFSELYSVPSEDVVHIQVRELGLLTISDDDLHRSLEEGAVVFMEPVLVSSSYGDELFTVSLIPVYGTMERILLQLVPVKSAEQGKEEHDTLPSTVTAQIPGSALYEDSVDNLNNIDLSDEFIKSSTLPIVICDTLGKILAWSSSCSSFFSSPMIGENYQEYLIPASENTNAKPALVCNAQDTNQMFQIYTATVKGQQEIVYMLVPVGEELHKIDLLSDENRLLSEKVLEYEEKIRLIEKNAIHFQEDGREVDVIVFSMGDEYYAMDVTMVREVVEMVPITPIPRTPPHMLGIINLRGEVTHVIDFARVLGTTSNINRDLQKIIVLPSDQTGGEHISIIVDSVQSVTAVSSKQISYLGDEITDQIRLHIKGIIKLSVQDVSESLVQDEGKVVPSLIIWLDMPALIASIRR